MFLVSQLAYDLYSTVSSGRKSASRDLEELEEVLFSLKCALDHLKDVSNDVIARPGLQSRDAGFKEKLDVMIGSCASTLQELDTVTKKYRLVEGEAGREKNNLRTLEDVKKSIRVNWQRVRWDREKQSLQQYREKLRSHTDAINLILTSALWATVASAGESSKKNHEKTQSLLGNLLRNPAVDAKSGAMVKEIHAVLMKPNPDPEGVQMEAIPSVESAENEVDVTANPLSGSLFGESSGPIEDHGKGLPSMTIYALSALPRGTPKTDAHIRPISTGVSVRGFRGVTSGKDQPDTESTFRHERLIGHAELPAATVQLNNKRRAFGAKEYEAFKKLHAQPTKVSKPYFLTSVAPTNQELQDSIPHIFQSTAEGKQQTQELKNEITRWTHEFSRFVNDTKATQANKDGHVLTLLGALNEAVDSSTEKSRQLFYDTSDSAGFAAVLDRIATVSKSVRVMKEIEEFQDAKEEWSEQTVR
ncbi:uncharacterized protein J4E78_003613 [Alternaria triticimaculans]|uniref:uncharacterized protein n=1 Tax=Alternaria triticimaculans TaxID=297637 RepID=UPI0020C1E39F|nr:uncharacterized protein J4E78_003613 [Alternaria triticimaculans]KAI4666145.1 hypothetical protein J4E78_003613 [Alternaria triticimaculans]